MSTAPHSPAPVSELPALPLVVQIGFAGSRSLYDRIQHPSIVPEKFEREVQSQLTGFLQKLRTDLHLSDRHFFCGISQIAIGADTVFTRCCQGLGIPQRIFLPDHRDSYLDAKNSKGAPDFSLDEKKIALELVASPHVIHECVVSDSPDRHERFRDANLEIMLASDVIVCLVRENAPSKAGGTGELITMAKQRKKPVLELVVAVEHGAARVFPRDDWPTGLAYELPRLPHGIEAVPALPGDTPFGPTNPNTGLPSVVEYATHLNRFTSAQAGLHSRTFKNAAFRIIRTHIWATVLALAALTLHHALEHAHLLPFVLAAELAFLVLGFYIHSRLHSKNAPQQWAICRLVSETTESVLSVGRLHIYLEHLFALQFPTGMRALLQTLSVLHLRSTVGEARSDWKNQRDAVVAAYLDRRFDGDRSQIKYHARESAKAIRGLKWARWIFFTCSLLAMLATASKFACSCCEPKPFELDNLLGSLAILLPVLAVAALSLAAALDLEARAHTFTDAFDYLKEQRDHILTATSRRDFARLVLGAESRLLGETVNWYARRSFTNVT